MTSRSPAERDGETLPYGRVTVKSAVKRGVLRQGIKKVSSLEAECDQGR